MTGTILKNEEFDIKGIFPTCSKNFSWNKEATRRESDADNFTILCSDFYNQVSHGHDTTQFSKLCRVLGLYLNHIKSRQNEIHVKSCCELFYYKLKKDIMHNLNFTDANICYKSMMKKDDKRKFSTSISNICVNYSANIDEDTSKLLEHLFKIYYYIDLFKNPVQGTTTEMRKFKQEIIDLENYSCNNKIRLKEELENIINVCEGYIKGWKHHQTAKHAASLLTENNWIDLRKIKLTELGDEILKKHRTKDLRTTEMMQQKTLYSQSLMITVTDDVTNTRISIGTVFLTFSILIIIFILYKYTPYFSLLKPSVLKLRRNLKKNYKNNPDLMFSFDDEYKNSVDDSYKIAYS
ncbi:variable surface protein [Plasmodium gonderi]|uniref:Variable surface protein n=1 Tax=Plasmodium gonderi TaxID=77519 RepID=A0A1Y1JPC2_PLAGO|nr:variable surface protein [Plasmodium gonderi]GAW84446.1 variable surface protein [Plasmodium gonderi]